MLLVVVNKSINSSIVLTHKSYGRMVQRYLGFVVFVARLLSTGVFHYSEHG